MFQDYVIPDLCKFLQAIVIEFITRETEGVALFHSHITKGVKTIGRLVIQRTITPHEYIVVTELNIAYEKLSLLVDRRVKIQSVRVQEVYPALGQDCEHYG